MTNPTKEAEKDFSNIVTLLKEANKPAENLAVRMGQFAQGGKEGGKGMEIIMRYLSGTGAWRMLNKIKATGQLVTEFYENIGKGVEEQWESLEIISEQLEVLKDIQEIKDKGLDTDAAIFKNLRLLYGEQKAAKLYHQHINDALDQQQKKVDKIRDSQMSNKDVIQKIKAEKKSIAEFDKAHSKESIKNQIKFLNGEYERINTITTIQTKNIEQEQYYIKMMKEKQKMWKENYTNAVNNQKIVEKNLEQEKLQQQINYDNAANLIDKSAALLEIKNITEQINDQKRITDTMDKDHIRRLSELNEKIQGQETLTNEMIKNKDEGIGEFLEKLTEEKNKVKELQAQRAELVGEKDAASAMGKARGITTGKGREYSMLTKAFMKPLRKIQKYMNIVSNFISGMRKIIGAVLKMALKAMLMGMLYLTLIVMAVLLLKPIIIKLWEKYQKFATQFGGLREHFSAFMETWNTTLKPLFLQAWESAKGFFDVLSDPNATIGDALSAGATMLMDLGFALWETLKAWYGEMIGPLLLILYNMGIELWAELKSWTINVLWPYLKENVPIWLAIIEEKLIWLKDWLFEHVPIWLGMAWDWLINTGIPKGKEKLKELWTWVTTELGPWLSDTFFPWVTNTLWPWLWEKFVGIIEFLFVDVAEWIVNEGIPLLIEKAGELKKALIGDWNPFKKGKAEGGPITKTDTYLVGEKGPELVRLNAGNYVVPNHALNSSSNSSNVINVSVNGRVGASDQELRDIARRVGSMINREINRTTTVGVR